LSSIEFNWIQIQPIEFQCKFNVIPGFEIEFKSIDFQPIGFQLKLNQILIGIGIKLNWIEFQTIDLDRI